MRFAYALLCFFVSSVRARGTREGLDSIRHYHHGPQSYRPRSSACATAAASAVVAGRRARSSDRFSRRKRRDLRLAAPAP